MKRSECVRKLGYALGCGAGGGLVALVLWWSGLLTGFEQASWGMRARFFAGPSEQTPRIRVILLDQESLDWAAGELGVSWPWPRAMYAPVVRFLEAAGARCVAFDVLYTEHSAYDVYDDQELADAIKASGRFVGAAFFSNESGAYTEWPEGVAVPPWEVAGLPDWVGNERRADLDKGRAAFPIPEFAQVCAQVADVHDRPDADGVFRRAAPLKVFDGLAVPSLGMAAFLEGRDSALPVRIEEGWLRWEGGRLPVDRQGRVVLRYRGSEQVYEPRRAAAVIQSADRLEQGLSPSIDPSFFEDAYVFFGFSAPGLMDIRATPVGRTMPGVLVHMTLLDNILEQDALRDAPGSLLLVCLLVMSVLAAAGTVFARKAWHHAVVLGLFGAAVVVLAFGAYPLGFWYPLAPQATGVALAALAGLMVNYATEGRQKLFIKRAFQHYLSGEVIERILSDPNSLRLGGERKELSIFFSDVQGFSTFSEQMGPRELTALLNDYLSAMTDIVFEQGGTLDKYEGDAIIAFWNAPLDQGDHALRACRAALRCKRGVEAGRAEWERLFGVRIFARIGVHTGEVVVGNMGSRERFDYTVLGDAANLASRLEGANKAFGTYLMVSEATWEQTGGELVGRCLGRIRVVGRSSPVTVYEPLAESPEEAPSWLGAYCAGIEAVFAGDWERALELFRGLGEDAVSRMYVRRCEEVLASGEPWDGVWNLTEK